MPPKKNTKKPKLDAEDEKELEASKQPAKKAGTRSTSRITKSPVPEPVVKKVTKTRIIVEKAAATNKPPKKLEVVEVTIADNKPGKKTTAIASKKKGNKAKPAEDSAAVAKDMDLEEEKEKSDDQQDDDAQTRAVLKSNPLPLQRKLTEDFDTGDGRIPKGEIKISSWNVNGLRAVLRKGELQSYLKSHNIDIICFNETKIDADKIHSEGIATSFPPEYNLYFNCCKTQKNYSGTGIATKYKPISVMLDIGVSKHDQEGRTITLEFENFYLVSCYVPNAGQKLVRVDYRTKEWDVDFRNFLKSLSSKKHVIWCGDLNVAHHEIDLYDPKGNRNKTAGFTDKEREQFTNLLNEGFVDSFRELHPDEVKYSWWSMRTQARKENKGWRLDYFVLDQAGMKGVKDSSINNDIEGSDHCPIELVYNPNI